MTGASGLPRSDGTSGETRPVTIGPPSLSDGAHMWRLAHDAGSLDVNSSYSYLLWCRDFASTSVVARSPEGHMLGFVSGYTRPERPGALVVWQVAVHPAHRGRGLASTMLDALCRSPEGSDSEYVETTITPGNTASERLFASFAERHGAPVSREVLFDASLFPDVHESEVLHRIGPFPHSVQEEIGGFSHHQ